MDDEIFYKLKLKCPMCGQKFIGTKVKTKTEKSTPIAMEDYLIPVYKDKKANPLSYEIDICPNCYYSAFHKDFKEGIKRHKNIMNAFSDEIEKLSKGIDVNTEFRNNRLARLSYILAAFIYSKDTSISQIKLGKCYTRIAWYSKELKDMNFYSKSIKKSLDAYLNAYNVVDDFEASSVIMYLIAVFYIELGDYESALPYVNKLNGNPEAKKIKLIKSKLEKITLFLREEIGKIRKDEKNLSSEVKKKKRRERKKESMPKKPKEPFGVELPKVDVSNLGKNKVEKEEDKAHILIVSEKKSDRLKLKTILAKLDDSYDIKEVTNAMEALQISENMNFKFIIMNEKSSSNNGFEFMQNLKSKAGDSKIIVFGRNIQASDIIKGMKEGIEHYLLAPINRKKLIDIIKKG
ncbi:MAG: DUF2225 domain-containing protein [Fusobacteriota bacterium]